MNWGKILQIANMDKHLLSESNWLNNLEVDDVTGDSTVESDAIEQFINLFNEFEVQLFSFDSVEKYGEIKPVNIVEFYSEGDFYEHLVKKENKGKETYLRKAYQLELLKRGINNEITQ